MTLLEEKTKVGDDGKLHINVYSKGKTELGRLLSNFTKSPFNHPEDGNFNSVEGYWYWLSCKKEELRKLYGYQAKKFGRDNGGCDWVETEEFKRKIKLAIKSKIEQNQKIYKLLTEYSLPFKHYYVFNEHVVEPSNTKWIIEYLEELRNEIRLENKR